MAIAAGFAAWQHRHPDLITSRQVLRWATLAQQSGPRKAVEASRDYLVSQVEPRAGWLPREVTAQRNTGTASGRVPGSVPALARPLAADSSSRVPPCRTRDRRRSCGPRRS